MAEIILNESPAPEGRRPYLFMAVSMHALMQERRNISGALRHGDDIDGLALGAVNDEIRADRPEPDRITREVFAYMAHAGIFAKASNASKSFAIQRSAASMLSVAM